MTDLSLVFDVLARDRASGVLRDVGDEAERTGRRTDAGLGTIAGAAKAAAAGLIGAGIISGFRELYDAAAESQRIGRLTESTIAATGGAANVTAGQVGDLAAAISAKTGIDDEAIQAGQNLLLTFKNISNQAGEGNDIFDQTSQIMADMSTVMGTDASGSAIQLGKALNDPIKGIGSLSRAGVQFTEEQKEQIRTLVESGDTLGAQKIILAELAAQFGGAAEAASTPLGKMQVAIGNVAEELGGYLVPAVEGGADAVLDIISGFESGQAPANGFDGVMQQIGVTIGDLADGVGFVVDVGQDMADFISGIPAPAIGAATALGAVVLLSGPLTAGFGAIAGGALATATSVVAASTSMVGFKAAGAGLIGLLGGPWGIALGVGAAAIGALIPVLAGGSEETDDFTVAQGDLASAIRATNGAIDDSVRRAAAKTLQDAGMLDIAEAYGVASSDMVGYILGEAGAHDRVTASLDAYVAATSARYGSEEVFRGTTDGIINNLDELAGTTSGTVAAERQLADATGGATTAMGAAVPVASALQGEMQAVKDELAAAKRATDDYKLSLDILTGDTITMAEAQAAFYAGIDEAAGATEGLEGTILNAAGSLNVQSEAGRAAQAALFGLRDDANLLNATLIEQGGSLADVTAQDASLRQSFIDTADEMGVTRLEAEGLANQILGIPAERQTRIAADTGQASAAIGGLFAQINQVAQDRVASIQFRATLSDIIGNLNPFGLADGGIVPGWSPHSRADNVPIAATAGEFMQPVRSVDYYGVDFMEQVRTGRFPLEVARGKYADGGLISLLGQADTAGASASIGKLNADFLDSANAAARAAVEPATDMARGLAYARSQVGKPYLWGSAGPSGFDCSGFMAAITNVIRGDNPNTRLGSTATFPWSGFAGGYGMFTVGSTPNASGGIGHMAGTLLGVNVESRGGDGVVVGGRARGASDGLFRERAHLATYDDGGLLQPGYTLAFNGTGKPEPIRTAEQEAMLTRPLPPIEVHVMLDGKPVEDVAVRVVDGRLEELYREAVYR